MTLKALFAAMTLKVKIIIVCAVLAVAAAGTAAAVFFTSQTDSYRVLKVLEMTGTSVVARENLGNLDVYVGMNLESGDVLTVGDESTLLISMDNDKYILLDEGTVIELIAEGTQTDSRTSINLKTGSILNEITSPLSSNSSYEVSTPKATMAVRGTSFRVTVKQLENGSYITYLDTINGIVSVQLYDEDGAPKGDEVLVREGCGLTIVTDPNETGGNSADVDGTAYFALISDGEIIPLENGEDPIYQSDYSTMPQAIRERAIHSNDSDLLILDYEIAERLRGISNNENISQNTADGVSEENSPVEPYSSDTDEESHEPQESVDSHELSQNEPEMQSVYNNAEETDDLTVYAYNRDNDTDKSDSGNKMIVYSDDDNNNSDDSYAVDNTDNDDTDNIGKDSEKPVNNKSSEQPIDNGNTDTDDTDNGSSNSEINDDDNTESSIEEEPDDSFSDTDETYSPDSISHRPSYTYNTSVNTPVDNTPTDEKPDTNNPNTEDNTDNDNTDINEPIAEYTVKFLSYSGELIYSETVADGSTLSGFPTVPEREGYTGVWSDGAAEIDSNTVITSDMSITAVYTPISYTVRFIASYDDSVLYTQTVEYGQTPAVPELPEIIDTDNNGYYDWILRGEQFQNMGAVTGDTDITAEYIEYNSVYEIRFKDGDEYVLHTLHVSGEDYTFPYHNPENEKDDDGTEYAFLGWGRIGGSGNANYNTGLKPGTTEVWDYTDTQGFSYSSDYNIPDGATVTVFGGSNIQYNAYYVKLGEEVTVTYIYSNNKQTDTCYTGNIPTLPNLTNTVWTTTSYELYEAQPIYEDTTLYEAYTVRYIADGNVIKTEYYPTENRPNSYYVVSLVTAPSGYDTGTWVTPDNSITLNDNGIKVDGNMDFYYTPDSD